MAFNDLIAQKIKDFEQQGVPQVFERDLDLGNPQEPKRDNIVNVIVVKLHKTTVSCWAEQSPPLWKDVSPVSGDAAASEPGR